MKKNNSRRSALALTAVLLGLLISQPLDAFAALGVPAQAERGISSNFLVGLLSSYNDNLFLDSTDQKQVYEQHVVPHFDLDYRNTKLSINLDYTGDYSYYSTGGDRLKNMLHFSRGGLNWRWHRDMTLGVSLNVSDRPIDLTKGGGVLTQALRVGEFRPPAVNSVLTSTVGVRQSYSRKLNGRTSIELGYNAQRLTTRGNVGRDVNQHGPALDLLYNFNKRMDLALSSSYSSQRYEGGIERATGRVSIQTDYEITPRLELSAGLGMEKLSYTRAEEGKANRSNLYYDFRLLFNKIPRTTLDLDYRRRVLADISASIWQIDEVGLHASHNLTRRLTLSSGVFSRQLDLIETELDTGRIVSDWMSGVDFQAQYRISRDIQPVLKVDYVFNRGKITENDFSNLRISTGFRYYFFSLN